MECDNKMAAKKYGRGRRVSGGVGGEYYRVDEGVGKNLQGRWPEIFTQELSIASDRNTKLNKKISLATGCRYTKRKLK